MDDSNKKVGANHLQKSAKILKICGFLFTITLVTNIIFTPFLPQELIIIESILTTLPIILIILLSPYGFYLSIVSFRYKEGSKIARFRIFYSHTIICILIILLIWVIISDIRSLF